MRHYLSKPSVTWGMLLLGTLCLPARAQAPRQPGPAPNGAATMPLGVGMPMPQTYAPPSVQQSFGLSTLGQPYGAPGTSVAQEFLPQQRPPAATQAPPSVNPLAQQESEKQRKRLTLSNLFNRRKEPEPKAAAPSTPAPVAAAVPQPRSPAQRAPAQPTRMIPTTAPTPAAGAATQLAGAQGPVGLPQGPVIICMPAGWQPPADFTFAPRQVSPEVTEDFWPVRTERSPLGRTQPGGMFRWPRFARRDAEDETPAPREPAKALVSNSSSSTSSASASNAQPPVDTTPPWKKILMAKSHEASEEGQAEAAIQAASPPVKSKALFSLSRKKPAPVAAPAVATRQAMPTNPRPPAATMSESPRPSPPVVARQQPRASRIGTTMPDAPTRLVTDSKNPKLQWRAKGAPRPSETDAEETSSDADDGARVAAHTEPVRTGAGGGPTPADPRLDPEYNGEALPAAPALEYEMQAAAPPPCPRGVPCPSAAPSAPRRVRSKALIPREVITGTPHSIPETPPEPALQLTSAPQAHSRALVDIVPKQPIPRPVVEEPVAPTQARNKALLPKMFVDYSASQIGLSTKPPAVPTRVGMSNDRAMDSYYAPPEREREVPRQARRASPQPRERQEAQHAEPAGSPQQRWAEQRAARRRPYTPPKQIPPLARPFWAISEMTKLPKFVTDLTGGAQRHPPRMPPADQRAEFAQQGVPHPEAPNPAAGSDQFADELLDAQTEAALDASERPSKRRTARDRIEASLEDESPESADDDSENETRTTLARHDEADQDADDDDEATPKRRADSAGNKSARHTDVRVVDEDNDGLKISRSKAVRMRKSDGSTVIVYYVKHPAPEKGDTEKAAEPVAKPKASKPAASPRRRVVRQADGDGKFRDNPLR